MPYWREAPVAEPLDGRSGPTCEEDSIEGAVMSSGMVACQQLSPKLGAAEENMKSCREAIRAAARGGAKFVLLPELVSSGYAFESAEEARAAAQPASGPAVTAWIEEAGAANLTVAGGFAELAEDGMVYNSVAIVDGTGLLAVYRKTHLWNREKLWFAPGEEVPPVVETAIGRVGLLVCYDLEFPENIRSLALRGAELVAVATNWPRSRRPQGERPPEVINAMASARFNRVFVACCDRVGPERGVEWTGGSVIVDELGWPLAEARHDAPGLIAASCELGRARDKSWTEYADMFGDRRPELYGVLTEGPALQ
jgi:5-aminopentanamidase